MRRRKFFRTRPTGKAMYTRTISQPPTPTHTTLESHGPSLFVPSTWCFHNVSAHSTFTVCETVGREVTDSIIPRRWAYIHLPPQDDFVPGKSSRPRMPPLFQACVYVVPYPLRIFLYMRKHMNPRARRVAYTSALLTRAKIPKWIRPLRSNLPSCSRWIQLRKMIKKLRVTDRIY